VIVGVGPVVADRHLTRTDGRPHAEPEQRRRTGRYGTKEQAPHGPTGR
jgi:hypothetical protein